MSTPKKNDHRSELEPNMQFVADENAGKKFDQDILASGEQVVATGDISNGGIVSVPNGSVAGDSNASSGPCQELQQFNQSMIQGNLSSNLGSEVPSNANGCEVFQALGVSPCDLISCSPLEIKFWDSILQPCDKKAIEWTDIDIQNITTPVEAPIKPASQIEEVNESTISPSSSPRPFETKPWYGPARQALHEESTSQVSQKKSAAKRTVKKTPNPRASRRRKATPKATGKRNTARRSVAKAVPPVVSSHYSLRSKKKPAPRSATTKRSPAANPTRTSQRIRDASFQNSVARLTRAALRRLTSARSKQRGNQSSRQNSTARTKVVAKRKTRNQVYMRKLRSHKASRPRKESESDEDTS